MNSREAVFDYLMTCNLLVTIQTGAVLGGQVKRDFVVVSDAPSRVVSEITSLFRMVSLSAEAGGLLIPVTSVPTD